mgnify:CR=1 FL=1
MGSTLLTVVVTPFVMHFSLAPVTSPLASTALGARRGGTCVICASRLHADPNIPHDAQLLLQRRVPQRAKIITGENNESQLIMFPSLRYRLIYCLVLVWLFLRPWN